jgi:tetratricopeptide (TPR) repeat protein
LLALREETRLAFKRAGIGAWTWEHWLEGDEFPSLALRDAPYPLATFTQIGVFREGLIESRAMVLFVSHRRGSPVKPWPTALVTYGTYLEIEVFFAIALKKPIILLREEGVSLEAPLEQLLEIARVSGAIHHDERISRAQLPRKALEAYRKVSRRLRSPLGRFTTFLAERRDVRIDYRTVDPFLFGLSLPPTRREPNLDAHDQLFRAGQDPGLTLSDRMTRLWLALQELLPFRPDISGDQELATRWHASLDAWASCASWFGLHSHLGVSPLIAQAERARLFESRPSLRLPVPYGPLSSARYSMARRQVFGRRRKAEMDIVVREAEQAIALGSGDEAGARSIIGFALLQNLRPGAAIEEFERSLKLRQAEQDEGRIGEGLADLGLALFVRRHPWRGTELLREGVEMLGRTDRHGFHLRTMKKLEYAYWATGQWRLARKTREQRTRKARSSEYFDQM